MRRLIWTMLAAALLCASAAAAQTHAALTPTDGDYVVRDFHFHDGETLATLKLHYTTLGQPRRDASGHVTNAVMVLHGTGGTGNQFLRPQFADVLFKPGGLLDPAQYYIILPDGVGHGGSSKPSDGMRMGFPKYDYDDMVAAQHALLVDGLHVDGLRMIVGTSMGCMHAFVWGETYPDFARALMPMACLPEPLVGRNRWWRALLIQSIEGDPAWSGGGYQSEPVQGMRIAAILLGVAGTAPIQMQKELPTRAAADAAAAKLLAGAPTATDANDLIYQVDASRNYDPSARLGEIKAKVMWINSGDDFINPPELAIAQRDAPRLKHGTFVLIPASDQTHGHGTHTWAAVWQDRMAALLAASAP